MNTAKIGLQEWATENLKVTKFRNGEDIPLVEDSKEWVELTTAAYCVTPDGHYLYNWYAVNDARGLAPEGFHIPSDDEWTELTESLGGQEVAGRRMKAFTWDGTNSSGFSALPNGFRNGNDGILCNRGYNGYWWSSSANGATYTWFHSLNSANGTVYRANGYQRNGLSVRCVRTHNKNKQPNVKQSNTHTMNTIKIGSQEWATEDLKVTKFRNGEDIPLVTDNKKWSNLKTAAYCISPNGHYLYNWYAVNDARGLCPTGFHVPTDGEWTVLENFLGGFWFAGGKMKSSPSDTPAWNGTNSSGFSALPGGDRSGYDGSFNGEGDYGSWWSSSPDTPNYAWYRFLYSVNANVIRNYDYQRNGFSVRCVRDAQ